MTTNLRAWRWLLLWLLMPLGIGTAPAIAQSTMVRLHTTQGPVDIQLLDAAAPKTVANFLDYVSRGAFVDTFVHRSVPGFVVQLGGYVWPTTGYGGHIPTRPPVANEFDPNRSNVRGTVAMAKADGDPDSATSEFFVNLADNSANLDRQNGGFTVFGRLTGPAMSTVDRIAALRIVNAGGAFTSLPVVDLGDTIIRRENVVRLESVTQFPPLSGQSEVDRIFNWLEALFPQFLAPSSGTPGAGPDYTFRYYARTNAYLGAMQGSIFYLVPAIGPEIRRLAEVRELIGFAAQAGY